MVLPENSPLQIVEFLASGKYECYDRLYPKDFLFDAINIEGDWRLKNDRLEFYETSLKFIFDDFELRYPYPPFSWSDEKINSLRTINYLPVGFNKEKGDNYSKGIVMNFGQKIVLPTLDKDGKTYYVSLVYVPRIKYFSEKKLTSRDIFSQMTQKEFRDYYRETMYFETDTRFQLDYFPWKPMKTDWQFGFFEVVSKTTMKDTCVKVELKKDSTIFTIVKPQYYLVDSKMNLFRKSKERALSAWMDTVQVGRSYEFELMRPAYPADSIAHFPPLQTVPDSIYAADGEAYGYFFARLNGPKNE